jgi:hypothetical protein
MRDSSQIWCETSDFGIEEIERRANIEFQNGNFPTLVYISIDLYVQLELSFSNNTRITIPTPVQPRSPQIVSIMTSVGSLNIRILNHLRNFLLVARKEDYDAITEFGMDPMFLNDQERQRRDKAFEDIVLEEKDDE